jgi:hypothetical protein
MGDFKDGHRVAPLGGTVRPRIFISYARLDDEVPEADDARRGGFVQQLRHGLRYELRQIGEPWPELWRDRERVSDGDPYIPILDDGLKVRIF